MSLQVVILAAGQGKRMASDTPKILHALGGISLLERVVNTARLLKSEAIHVVYGNGSGKRVRKELAHLPVNWVEQADQLGTGHAVLQTLPFFKNDDDRVLILYADVPLISLETLQDLLARTPDNGLGLIIAEPENPSGLGRIIRNESGHIVRIVEDKDATKEQRLIREINSGILSTSVRHLKNWLPKLSNTNQQKEYYLTDAIALAATNRHPIGDVMARCFEEVQGVNDRLQLATLERFYQQFIAKKLLLEGVTIIDPMRIDIRGEDIQIGRDTVIDINVILEGCIRVGSNVRIGPHVFLKNVSIEQDTDIYANSVIEGATIGPHCQIGPFARLRPGTVIEANARVGNFVEVKNSTLGIGSKANHLSYLGDADIGNQVNIGAGTITCNYDGVNKWPTIIEDEAFIGSNVSLVAPIKIGRRATIGAGSTITRDAAEERLTLARARQIEIDGWERPQKKVDDKP